MSVTAGTPSSEPREVVVIRFNGNAADVVASGTDEVESITTF